jgi:hypothetical protein
MNVDAKLLQQILTCPRVAANMRRQVQVIRDFDLPNITGYSWDGHTIYVDKDVPSGMLYRGGRVDVANFTQLRARVEKAVIDAYRHGDRELQELITIRPEDQYTPAAAVGRAAEENAVRMSIGEEGLSHYRAFIDCRKKDSDDPALRRVPKNLDLTPYRDAAHQMHLKRRMVD